MKALANNQECAVERRLVLLSELFTVHLGMVRVHTEIYKHQQAYKSNSASLSCLIIFIIKYTVNISNQYTLDFLLFIWILVWLLDPFEQ
jgi:hypothetical protein